MTGTRAKSGNRFTESSMWELGECRNEHTLTDEDYTAGRCLQCKRAGNRRSWHATTKYKVAPVRFEYRTPEVRDPAWQLGAHCAGEPLATFFPETGGSFKRGKELCAGCPLAVRRDCLAFALIHDDMPASGLAGGLGPAQRMQIRRGKRSFEETLGLDGEPTVSVPLAQAGVAAA